MSIETGHDAARCPRCGALVRPGSPWCTLCYADLRPAPAPPPVPTPPHDLQPARDLQPLSDLQSARGPAPDAPSGASVDPLTAPLALLERQHAGAPRGRHAAPEPDEQAESVESADPTADPAGSASGWPCARCGAMVALTDAACPSCGAGFLEGAATDDSPLSRIVGKAVTTQGKAFIMVGGSLGLLVLLLGLMYLFGTVF